MSGFALGIDTAGPVVGVALVGGGAAGVIIHRSARLVRGADGWLGPQVAEILALADDPGGPCEGAGISRIGVSTGPGAFTGLRVGVAMALGLSAARGLPVASISSLRARASRCAQEKVLALLDARKGRMYGGLFDCSGVVPEALGPELDAELHTLLPAGEFWATGEGAEVQRDAIERAGGRVPLEASESAAAAVARLSVLEEDALGPASEVQLRYIRLPDAKKPADRGGSR